MDAPSPTNINTMQRLVFKGKRIFAQGQHPGQSLGSGVCQILQLEAALQLSTLH